MKIGEMFEKPIDRDIKGVIKVGQDDEESIYQELNEYVVTAELSKHFREFFENYKKGIDGQTDEMGVWISGFFGSGKSHFLKILSYILENREVRGRRAIDFFLEDGKITDHTIIADMDLATSVPTDVILFNIASKSSGTESSRDPILDVFVKVFNEMRGFCGEIPFLAEMESKLDSEGLFDDFKAKFLEINGNDWLSEREDFYFIQDDVVEALSSINYMSREAARNWVEKAEDNYSISIEKFAKMVKEYCDSRSPKHHVVFLVDEIGQYIGDDSGLMLNLQTLVEELGIHGKGRIWVVVTSQEDIDSIIDVRKNDFSKIQGRFKTRLSLTSVNVDEVIRRRILKKNESGSQTLEALYDNKNAILKNLISFSSDTSEKKMYVNGQDFAEVYPFIPYQFNLLGDVLTSIRIHGASGKHLAEGERSMLALFQEAAISIMEEEAGALVPFNRFYDSLDRFVDHTHSSVIKRAANNDKLDEFDVEVLKVLFLIKYVKGIKGTPENLTTLMIENIDDDRVELREKVEKSLGRLLRETLIQKNGDVYSFLTDDEQAVWRAIKQENVEIGEILNETARIIFEDIYEDKKYRYNKRYNFPFNRAVDDIYYGKQHAEIGVRIITPYHDIGYPEDSGQTTLSPHSDRQRLTMALRAMSEEKNEAIFYLDNAPFLAEIEELLKIKKYLTREMAFDDKSKATIINTINEERDEKNQRIRISIENALKESEVYVKGERVDINDRNPSERINSALEKLVNKIYSKLPYMEFSPVDSDILEILRGAKNETLTEKPETRNQNAIDEIMDYIERQTRIHAKPSLKTVFDRFRRQPYGYIDEDIAWLISVIFSQRKISLERKGQNLSLRDYSPNDFLRFLKERRFHEEILIDKRESIPEFKIKSVREVFRDLFSETLSSDDEEVIMGDFQRRTADKLKELGEIFREYQNEKRLPGKNIIDEAAEMLREVSDLSSTREFFDFIHSNREELQDLSEELEPVIKFFEGKQKEIFERACEDIDLYEKNRNLLESHELRNIADRIREIIEMETPYSKIPELPDLSTKFEDIHNRVLEEKRAPVRGYLKNNLKELLEQLESMGIDGGLESDIQRSFQDLCDKLERSEFIHEINGIKDESDSITESLLNRIKPDKGDETPEEKRVNIRDIINSGFITIRKKEDIDELVTKIRMRLEDELDSGTVITLKI